MLLSVAFCPPVEYFAHLAEYSSVYVESCESYRRQTWRNRCRILAADGPVDISYPIVHDGERLITKIRVDYSTPWVRKMEQAVDSAYFSSPFFEYYRDDFFAILDSRPETLWELDLRTTEFFLRKIGLRTALLPTTEFLPPSGQDGPSASSGPGCPGQVRPVALLKSQICGDPATGLIPPKLTFGPLPLTGPRVGTPARTSQPLRRASGPSATEGETFEGASCRGANNGPDLRYSLSPKVPSGYAGRPYWQVFRQKFGFVGGLSVMDLLFNEGPESLTFLR